MKKLAALMLLAAGCTEEIGPDPDDGSNTNGSGANGAGGDGQGAASTQGLGYENGSRLRAKVYVGEDGSRQFVQWHDSERNEDCGFTRAADGKIRCVPGSSAQVIVAGNYADAGCTQPVVRVTAPCATAPTYASNYVSENCGSSLQLVEVGAPLATVYSGSPANCVVYNIPEGWTFYEVGSEVPPSSFAEATAVIE